MSDHDEVAGTSFLLVHAPLLGPGTWKPCAELISGMGHDVVVPDLRPSVRTAERWWERVAMLAEQAAGTLRTPPVVVGHSGAGVVLPLVAQHIRVAGVVLVDAVVPAVAGASMASQQLRDRVGELVDGDHLRPWTSWWSSEVMAELVPDAGLRALVDHEQPRLPADFFDEPVPVPDGWEPESVTYLQLTSAYDDDAARATGRGWTVRQLPGLHLDILRRPVDIAGALADAAV